MATEITMPQLSDTMDHGTILKWFKKEGDSVSRGDALAEVATDKADLEIESFHEGVLLKINSSVGETVKVGSLIAVIGQAGESVTVAPADNTPKSSAAVPERASKAETSNPIRLTEEAPPIQTSSQPQAVNQQNFSNGSERVKISPLAKNIAKNHGIDFSGLSGTGDGGRIIRRDVEKALTGEAKSERNAPAAPRATGTASSSTSSSQMGTSQAARTDQAARPDQAARTEPLSKMRETIAARMVESVTTAPHFYATSRIEVDHLLKAREILKGKPAYEGITVTHLIIKAAGLSLRAFPRINSRYENGHLVEPQSINIGIITALPDGLLIPVIKSADNAPLVDIVTESRTMIQRARAGKPKADDLQGGTFSISNIGKNEVEHFTAIINPGQGAILAVSSIQDEALVKNGAVVPGKTMRVTLSVDHRIIDGVMAGEFLTHFKSLLEEPLLLLA